MRRNPKMANTREKAAIEKKLKKHGTRIVDMAILTVQNTSATWGCLEAAGKPSSRKPSLFAGFPIYLSIVHRIGVSGA